ncbi:hypothetical protein HDV05_003937 [Chytridiales sp. JEL 0842]|nr:hypothetical protein HDV05_003937 [Chytridiales sp. JEL 0842]
MPAESSTDLGDEDSQQEESGLFSVIGKTLTIIWNLVLAPLGIALIQIITAFLKAAWYGPFGPRELISDGLLGSPNPEAYDQFPFDKQWKPSHAFIKGCGIVLGAGLGLRNYVEFLFLILRSAWYGAIPETMNSPDGFFTVLTQDEETPVYSTSFGRATGAVFGLVVGFRFIVNGLYMAIKGLCYGPEPDKLHLADGLLVPSGITHQSIMGRTFGFIFGIGVGLYPFLNFVTAIIKGIWYGGFPELFEIEQHFIPIGSDEAYSTMIGRGLGWIFGAGVGLFGIINGVLLIPCAAYYGAMGEKYLTWGILGPPQFPMRTTVGITLGCIFGFYFGFRTLIDVIATNAIARFLDFLYRVIILNLWCAIRYTLSGLWVGLHPQEWHLTDGLIPPPKPSSTPPESEAKIASTCRTLGAILAFGIGYRTIINFFTMLPRCIWFGAAGPDQYLKDGWFPPPKTTLTTPFARTVGFFVGAVIGLRTIFNIPGVILRSFWFGANPAFFHMADGLLPPPPLEPIYKTTLGKVLGYVVGLGVGFRAVLCALTVIPKGMWLGVYPEGFRIADGLLEPKDVGTWRSNVGRPFGVFGGLIGFHVLANGFTVLVRGAWYGLNPQGYWLHDGILGPSPSAVVSPFGKVCAVLFGFGVGWRNIIDTLLMSICSAWFGRWGRLYVVDLPKGFKMIKKSTDNLTAVVVQPTPEDLEVGKAEQKERELARKSRSHLSLANLVREPSATLKRSASKLFGMDAGKDATAATAKGSGLTVGPTPSNILATAEVSPTITKPDVSGVSEGPPPIVSIVTVSPESATYPPPDGPPPAEMAVPAPPKNTPVEQTDLPSPTVLIQGEEVNPFSTPTIAEPTSPSEPATNSKQNSQNPFTDPSPTSTAPPEKSLPVTKPSTGASVSFLHKTNSKSSNKKIYPDDEDNNNNTNGGLLNPNNPKPKGYMTVGIDGSEYTLNNNSEGSFTSRDEGPSWAAQALANMVKGRQMEDWMLKGASTWLGAVSGSILVGLSLAAIVAPISFFFYVPSSIFRSTALTAPDHLRWWYASNVPAPAVLGSLAFLFGLTVGYLGLRNIISPYFYSRTLLPMFLVKLWNPAILPLLEIIAVLVALAAYLPFFSLVVTLRRLVISFNYLLTSSLGGCKGGNTYAITVSPRRRKPVRISGTKVFKSLLRILLPTSTFVLLFLTLPPAFNTTYTNPSLPSFTSPLIAFGACIFVNPLLDRLFKLLFKSHRQSPTPPASLAAWESHGLKPTETKDADSILYTKIKEAKQGKGHGDTAGPLRIWLRDLGFWSEAEVRLKDLHDWFRRGDGSLQVVRDLDRLGGGGGVVTGEKEGKVYSFYITNETHLRVVVSVKTVGGGLLPPTLAIK